MSGVYTPASLAKQMGCSDQHIRNLINRGELRAFRFGKKLMRIPAEAVEEYLCRNTVSSDIGESGPSPTKATKELSAARLARMTREKLRPSSPTS